MSGLSYALYQMDWNTVLGGRWFASKTFTLLNSFPCPPVNELPRLGYFLLIPEVSLQHLSEPAVPLQNWEDLVIFGLLCNQIYSNLFIRSKPNIARAASNCLVYCLSGVTGPEVQHQCLVAIRGLCHSARRTLICSSFNKGNTHMYPK